LAVSCKDTRAVDAVPLIADTAESGTPVPSFPGTWGALTTVPGAVQTVLTRVPPLSALPLVVSTTWLLPLDVVTAQNRGIAV